MKNILFKNQHYKLDDSIVFNIKDQLDCMFIEEYLIKQDIKYQITYSLFDTFTLIINEKYIPEDWNELLKDIKKY